MIRRIAAAHALVGVGLNGLDGLRAGAAGALVLVELDDTAIMDAGFRSLPSLGAGPLAERRCAGQGTSRGAQRDGSNESTACRLQFDSSLGSDGA